MEPVGDAKQLFEIKRALTIIDDNESIKKTSGAQEQEKVGDGFGPCPLCSEITTRDKIWENSYAFTSVTPNTYTSTVSVFDHSAGVVSVNSDTSSKLTNQLGAPGNFLGSGECPVCGGSAKSPSSYNGTWAKENKDDLVITSIRSKIKQLMIFLLFV